MNETTDIPGYDYGAAAKSSVMMDELAKLKETTSLTEKDRRYLALAGEVLSDQAENLVDAWRARIGAQEHLAKWFYGPDGKPDEDYKAAVKRRFVQWVIDRRKLVCGIRQTRRTRPTMRERRRWCRRATS